MILMNKIFFKSKDFPPIYVHNSFVHTANETSKNPFPNLKRSAKPWQIYSVLESIKKLPRIELYPYWNVLKHFQCVLYLFRTFGNGG